MSPADVTRRGFLGGAAALAALLPAATDALAEPRRRGRLDDVEHVVVLMQENRSFDHYYGTMRGVRGFGDAAALPGVFTQTGVKPFHVDTQKVDGQDLGDLGHGWSDQHQAIALGAENMWVPAKGPMTMSYFTAADIPFHRALADAFTLCDHYHCSIQGPTTPNRLYLFTGTIDADGHAGGAAIDNPPDYKPVYRWTTYPERLQDAGVSWKVYANKEVGDDGDHPFAGDYGDNPLWLFDAYHRDYSSELSRRASVHATWEPDSGQGKDVHHVLAEFEADCAAGTLPAVSWVVAPYGYSEHPAARPVDGAAYTQGVVDAIAGNPALWRNTVLLIDYDENDGFFDHVPPPMPPAGTPGEFVQGLPIGLGARVPMTVVSPWSRGGFVNSQVADHTSVIRFLETWTGVREPNISDWRRAVCGDLTSCFDFASRPVVSVPRLPDTAALRAQADATQSKLPAPAPPLVPSDPVQESGARPARPLPYRPSAAGSAGPATLTLTLGNTGTAAVPLAVHGAGLPRQHVVTPGTPVTDTVPAVGAYDVAVYGPNRFLARFAGGVARGIEVDVTVSGPALRLTLHNDRTVPATVTITASRYGSTAPETLTLAPRSVTTRERATEHGWYDVTVTAAGDPAFARRFTGRIEDGRTGVTG